MTLTATIYSVDVELTDTDRHVYQSLALRIARHPSESEEYFVTRLLASDDGERVMVRGACRRDMASTQSTSCGLIAHLRWFTAEYAPSRDRV
jgi:uncharacterized protein YaeQ